MSPPIKEPTATGMALRTALILFVFVVIFTGLLSGAYLQTKPAVEASAAAEKMKLIDEVLPPHLYDNDLLADTFTQAPEAALGLDETSTVYRARKAGKPVALVLEAVAPNGYAGKIRLIVAVGTDKQLIGVRVTQHKETPGLGDYIEPKKDKNKGHPWIGQFTQLSYGDMADRDWRVKKDGGRFEFRAGATVTPRAVVAAVGRAVAHADLHRDRLFAIKEKP